VSAPSGAQIEITHGDQRAVVVEVGGGLRSYSARERDLIDGYPADRMCSSGRGQLLAPWPNRIGDGRYEWAGRDRRLALSEPGRGNAIHGLVRWAGWRVAEHDRARAVLEYVLHPHPGYPHRLELSVEYALDDTGLSVQLTATNAGDDACPYGCGAHPYLTLGAGVVDPLVLHVPAGTVLESNDRGLPTGAMPVAGTPFDFRTPRPIGDTRLDHAFTDLERGDDGRVRVELRDAASGDGVALWAGPACGYLMLFTGDPLADVARRSIAVEPMTCPPDAFRSGEDVVGIEPGESFTASWGLEPITGRA
jgi:aldose 1-epimerase